MKESTRGNAAKVGQGSIAQNLASKAETPAPLFADHSANWTGQFFFSKGPESILGFEGPVVSVTTAQLCHQSTKAVRDNMYMNGHHCVPIKLYLWTLKWEFHIIFTCHNIFFF